MQVGREVVFPVADGWVTRKNLPLGGEQQLETAANTPTAEEQKEESARWPIGIAAKGLCLPFLEFQNVGSARESAGNNRKEGVHVAAASAPFLVNGAAGSASTRKRENPLQITTPPLGSVWNGRERTFLDI